MLRRRSDVIVSMEVSNESPMCFGLSISRKQERIPPGEAFPSHSVGQDWGWVALGQLGP